MRDSLKRDSKRKKKGVFDVSLSQAIQFNKLNNNKLPDIVDQVVTYLEKNDFIKLEGIYRVSGRKLRIEQLKEAYDKGKRVNFEENREDPFTCADLLLLFLRSLPESIFTPEKSYDFEMAVEEVNDEVKIFKLTELIFSLPIVNKYLLKYICEHLSKVISQEKENKMGVNNIAIVFVPSMQCNAKLFAFLIIKFQTIFKPRCSLCKRNIPIEEDIHNKDLHIICMDCEELTNPRNGESRTSGSVEASPDPKKKGLIRSISQKWKDRKKEKKGSSSDVEDRTTDDESRKSDREKKVIKKVNGIKRSDDLSNSAQVSITKTNGMLDSPSPNEVHKVNSGEKIDSNELSRVRIKESRSNSTTPVPLTKNPTSKNLKNNFIPPRTSLPNTAENGEKKETPNNTNNSNTNVSNRRVGITTASPPSVVEPEVLPRTTMETHFPSNETEEGLLFGAPLEKVCKKNGASIILPAIVKKSIEYIDKKGIDIEEIYRIPGDIEIVKKIRKTLNEDSVIDFDMLLMELPPITKCHTVTMLFKLYLRQLPTNVFTESYIVKLEDIIKNEKDRGKKVTGLAYYVFQLPQENRTLILHLISHFRSVTKKIGKNKMSIQRLAIIFKDVLFCSQELITTIYEYRRAILQPSCHFCKKMLPAGGKMVIVDENKIHCGECDKSNPVTVAKTNNVDND